MRDEFFTWLQRSKGVVLSAQQRAAVENADATGLLVATPGSGKTTVIVCRTAYLMQALGVPAQRILTLTYGKQSQLDMQRRFSSWFAELEQPRFSTFHALCLDILRRYTAKSGGVMFDLMSDSGLVLRNILMKNASAYVGEDLMGAVSAMLEYVSNSMLDAKEIAKLSVEGCEFAQVYADYTRYKRENRVMDFGDMLTFAHRALEKYPALLQEYRSAYAYIQIDEAQDTSPIQQRIADMLAGEDGRLFLVGDEDQSIYGFRGSAPDYMMRFEGTHPGALVLYMQHNYRSCPQIVQAAGNIIRWNAYRRQKVMTADACKNGVAQQVELPDWSAQAEYVVKRAQALAPGQTLGVLFRNNDSAPVLCDALLRAGIPFSTSRKDGKPGLFTHFVMRNLRSLITLSYNPCDGEAFFDVRNRIKRDIPHHVAAHIRKSGQDVFEQLCALMPLSVSDAAAIQKKANTIGAAKGMRAYNAVGEMIDQFYLDGRGANTQKTDALLSLAKGVETLHAYIAKLDELELMLQTDAPRGGQVFLSTIHAAKGLEYDEVILIDGMEGVLPASDKHDTTKERATFEEETRLAYVAVTRARSSFTYLNAARSHGRLCGPSLFAQRIFPKQEVGAARLPACGAVNRGMPARTAAKPRANDDFTAWQGKTIRHRRFGKGVVVGVQRSVGVVLFEDGERSLDLSVGLSAGAITRIKD